MQSFRYGLIASLLFAVASQSVGAETFPSKPIHIVVPYAVGGGADTVTRLLQPALQKALDGATIIVENKPGAGTVIGTESVARAAPDGYTVLVTLDQTMTMNPFLYKKLPYDPEKSFRPVSVMAMSCIIYLVSKSVPVKTLDEFAAYAKQNDKLNFASGAITGQVTGQRVLDFFGVRMPFILYPGGVPTLSAMINDEVQFAVGDAPTFQAAILDGRIKALAVSTAERNPKLPEVPTMAELGHPNLASSSFWAMYAPAGTPDAIIQRLNKALQIALADKDTSGKITSLGVVPKSTSPEELQSLIKAGLDTWGPVIRSAGIKAE